MAKFAFIVYVLLWIFLDQLNIASLLISLTMTLPYSRRLEREADIIGLYLMTAACFDPAESPATFERMGEAIGKGGKLVEFLSTHPATKGRVQEMRKMLPELREKYYEKCGMHQDFIESFPWR